MNSKITAINGLTAFALVAAGSGAAFAADNQQSGSASQTPSSRAQGLYSTDQLMDANVYAKGDSENSIGEIDDVLLDNDMKIKAFVVETNGKFHLFGGKSYVVSPDDIKVQTKQTGQAKKPEYRISLDMSRNDLAKQSLYSDSWWTKAQSQADNAWQNTKHSASSAWSTVSDKTSSLFNDGKNTAGNTADKAGNAANDAGSSVANGADKAQDKAANAADSASDKASDAGNSASDKAKKAGDKASNAADNAADKADDAADDSDNNG